MPFALAIDRTCFVVALTILGAAACLGKGSGPVEVTQDVGTSSDGDRPPGDAAGGDSPGADEPLPPPPVMDGNNASRALGFELFYRERLNRHLITFNRFAIAGDAVFAHAVAQNRVAKTGNAYEVLVGPNDNNPIGKVTFEAAQAYAMFGGHELELTLIRLFEGLVFLEEVSGHPGLTCRMALPGWTLTLDGVADTVTRTRGGVSVASPVVYSPALETAILDTFFAGTQFTYWENPEDQYVLRYPIGRTTSYASTWVFSGLPTFLRISNCCASYIISQKGTWRGAYWSNHNSRDNFPDLVMGYLAAVDVLRDPNLPSDLWVAAQRARVAGERVGARVIGDGSKLMTVSEFLSYDELIPGGATRPDLRHEDGDLGSLNTCQLVYIAEAVSPAGLDVPAPVLPLGDSVENLAFRALMTAIGVDLGSGATTECHSLDDAMGGKTWGEILTAEVLGVPWVDFIDDMTVQHPEQILPLVRNCIGAFQFLELSSAALVYYGEVVGRPELERTARQTLANLVAIHRVLAGALMAAAGDPADPGLASEAMRNRYLAAIWASAFGVDAPTEDYAGFDEARGAMARRDVWWDLPDTELAPLLSDAELAASIEAELDSRSASEPWIVDRYQSRFAAGPPVRRAGEGYEAVDLTGQWVATANSRHRVYSEHHLFFELPLCVHAPEAISCAWARLGCGRPDLDESGIVDAVDQMLFDEARLASVGIQCTPRNSWCQGADLDRNYVVDQDDAAFMAAAQGCRR
jgi:hypothetical protein